MQPAGPQRGRRSARRWPRRSAGSRSGSRTNARTTRMPVICSRSTRLTQSMRSCISRNCGIIRRMIRPIATTITGTLTSISQDRPTSSRSAMMMPPTHMIGAATSIVQVITTSICTCCTSLVVRVISDGAPNCPTSRAENSPTRWKIGAAQVAAEAHRGPRAEVDGDDRADDLDGGDQQHPAADAQDVAGVAGGDALVDDVGVEAGQVERGHGADELQQRPRASAVARTGAGRCAAVGSAQVPRLWSPGRRTPSSRTVDDLLGVSRLPSVMSGWDAGEGQQAQQPGHLGDRAAEAGRVGLQQPHDRGGSGRCWPGPAAACGPGRPPAAACHAHRDHQVEHPLSRRWMIAASSRMPLPQRQVQVDAAQLGQRRQPGPAPPAIAALTSASLSGKTRKIVPSATPAASAICRVVTFCRARRAAAGSRRSGPPAAPRAAAAGPGRSMSWSSRPSRHRH